MLSLKAEQEVDLGKITNKLNSGIKLDFYLPDNKIAIEVHGIQHYQPQSFGADSVSSLMSYNRQLFRDDKLRNVCNIFNIKNLSILIKN